MQSFFGSPEPIFWDRFSGEVKYSNRSSPPLLELSCRKAMIGILTRQKVRMIDGFISYMPSNLSLLLMAEILHQLRLVVYPILCKVLYIPGGAGFQPSTVVYSKSMQIIHGLALKLEFDSCRKVGVVDATWNLHLDRKEYQLWWVRILAFFQHHLRGKWVYPNVHKRIDIMMSCFFWGGSPGRLEKKTCSLDWEVGACTTSPRQKTYCIIIFYTYIQLGNLAVWRYDIIWYQGGGINPYSIYKLTSVHKRSSTMAQEVSGGHIIHLSGPTPVESTAQKYAWSHSSWTWEWSWWSPGEAGDPLVKLVIPWWSWWSPLGFASNHLECMICCRW